MVETLYKHTEHTITQLGIHAIVMKNINIILIIIDPKYIFKIFHIVLSKTKI